MTTFISLNKALYPYPTTEACLPLHYLTYAPPPQTSPEHERPGRLRKVHSFLHLSQPFQSKPRCLEQAQGARSRQGWRRWGGLLATCCQHLRYLRKPTIGNATATATTAISTLAQFGAGRAGRPLRVFDPAHRVQELREQNRSGEGGLMFRPWLEVTRAPGKIKWAQEEATEEACQTRLERAQHRAVVRGYESTGENQIGAGISNAGGLSDKVGASSTSVCERGVMRMSQNTRRIDFVARAKQLNVTTLRAHASHTCLGKSKRSQPVYSIQKVEQYEVAVVTLLEHI